LDRFILKEELRIPASNIHQVLRIDLVLFQENTNPLQEVLSQTPETTRLNEKVDFMNPNNTLVIVLRKALSVAPAQSEW